MLRSASFSLLSWLFPFPSSGEMGQEETAVVGNDTLSRMPVLKQTQSWQQGYFASLLGPENESNGQIGYFISFACAEDYPISVENGYFVSFLQML